MVPWIMFNPHYSPYIIYFSTFTPRTSVESGAIFHDGYEFLKIYKRLTGMSLRLGFQGVGLNIEYTHTHTNHWINSRLVVVTLWGLESKNGFYDQNAMHLDSNHYWLNC